MSPTLKTWDVKKVYPVLDKVFQQRLGTASLASNTLVNTLINNLSETLTLKIEQGAVKLDSLSNSTEKVTDYVATAMAPFERYIAYSAIGIMIILSVVVLIWCHRLETALLNLAMHLENKDTKLTNLLTQTIQAQAKVVQDNLNKRQKFQRGKHGRHSARPLSNALEYKNTSV